MQNKIFPEFWQKWSYYLPEEIKQPKLSARANKVFIGVPILQHEPGTDLVFQTTRFPEFWQSEIPANEGKKNKCQNSRLVQTKCLLVCQA